MTSSMVMIPTGGVPSSPLKAAVPEMLRWDACNCVPVKLADVLLYCKAIVRTAST